MAKESQILDTKFCSKCLELKPKTTEFFSRKTKKSPVLRSICKPCERIYDRALYHKHIDKQRARTKAWRKNNPEKFYLSDKMWRIKNKQKAAENVKQLKQEHPEKIREYNKR